MLRSLASRFMFALCFILPLMAFAQVTGAADPVSMLTEGINTLASSAQAKNWALFIPTLIVLVVTVFRWLGGKLAAEGTGFRGFLDNKWTKWAMNFITAGAGAFISAATAHIPVTGNLVVNALLMSFAAAGGVEFFRDVVDHVGVKKAEDAGKNAVSDPSKTLNS